MLAAVLSDGTAVNIVKRGDDVISGAVHLPTVIDDNGKVYGLFADVPSGDSSFEEFVFVVDGGVITATYGFSYGSSIDGSITIFSTENGSENCCPEVLDWLCRNYGLAFSPVDLYLYRPSGMVSPYSVSNTYCLTDYNVYLFGTAEDSLALRHPNNSSMLLGCDGTAVSYDGATDLVCSYLADIRSNIAIKFKGAYNAWLFYLASGLPKSVFEDI